MLIALIGFLITIGILVVIHEFGHYFMARIFKVKVITFSIGFGPQIFSWHSKHNQWCISLIPLGGYVRMLDEREAPVAPEEKQMAFNNKPPYQKILIAFAGPLFNIIFAFFAYYCMGLYGVYDLKPIIATVNPTPLVKGLNQIPEGSSIVSINNQKIQSWTQAEDIFLENLKYLNTLEFKFRKSESEIGIKLDLDKFIANKKDPSLTSLGLLPFRYLTTISYVEPQSPAANAGLLEDDQIISINHQQVDNWFRLSNLIRNSPSEKITVTVLRANKKIDLNVIPNSAMDDNGQIIGKIGIMPTLDSQLIQQNSFIKKYNPLTSLGYAYNSCITLISTNLAMLKLMISGEVSWHNLGGPVAIAKASKSAIHQGVKAFVDFLALISLSLAVMNLLPIPILDGGHILIYSIEWLRGRPVDLSIQQFLFKAGLIIVLSLTGMALYNDFLKLLHL